MIRGAGGTAHFLNAENDFFYTGLWSRRFRWHTIGTFHFPPSSFGAILPKPSALRRLDAAICVSRSQVSSVKELLGHDRVWFIPLGVDTDFFCPDAASEAPIDRVCLFVGIHLRDFETLGRVATELSRRRATAKVVVIVPARYATEIRPHPCLEIHTGVSDTDLRDWYRRAALLLLPVKDATATSAILEAMACGTPIVTNDVGGTPDYVSAECGFLCPVGDAEAMTAAAIQLLDDEDLNARMRAGARRRAQEFSWPIVAQSIARIYADAPKWRPASESDRFTRVR